MKLNRENKAITLISLVITIVVLIILSAVAINLTLGNNGILNKAKEAKNETLKQAATEKMNLKITNMQIEKYTQEQRMPTLQEFSDGLCEDDEIQYVQLESKKVGSLSKIEVGEAESIFTKLKEYPYEFEINSSLQLASIDGIKLADNNNGTITLTQSQYDSILSRLSALENNSNNITSGENYSTEEKIVGTWIDGKPLYQKTIIYNKSDFGSAGEQYLLHNIVNVEKIWYDLSQSHVYATVNNSLEVWTMSNNNTAAEYNFTGVWANTTTLSVYIGSNLFNRTQSSDSIVITVKYTKTTDTANNN